MLNRDGEMVSWQIMENQRRNRNRKIWKNGKADEEDEEMESWKSKRADDRMHKISFHADKICHTGKYGKQPNTKYQMLSEQIISYFPEENKNYFVKFSLLQHLKINS